MLVFKTQRLSIKVLEEKDQKFFIELLSAPEIIKPVPQKEWSLTKILEHFRLAINAPKITPSNDKVVWGIYELDKDELIGLCAILKNDEQQREIGYRFRKKYWKKGYGTELTQHLIDYCFNTLKFELITADVNITNTGSVKILEKFLKPIKEFYNENDNCIDRRYLLKKQEY
ncbi:MAG: GNAT family N-acetyltransferase [Flavobacteriales bacterium]|jgi:RimJ/RimL family protein N-acetyltransferase|nr:GNAT family N-acetyltransferase [Flavobacteriales bacterium]